MIKFINRYDQYIYAIIIFLAIWASHGCSPVKNVLRSPAKTQQVVDAYNANVATITAKDPVIKPGKSDTTHKDGVDTSTTKTVFDTLYVPGDTVQMIIRITDTVTLNKTRTVTINKTDTLDRQDPALIAQLQSFQRLAVSNATAKDQFQKDASDSKAAATKWKLYFFILLAACVIATCLTIFFKIKS